MKLMAKSRMEQLRAARDSYNLLDRRRKQSPKAKAAYHAATAELNRLADESRKERWAKMKKGGGRRPMKTERSGSLVRVMAKAPMGFVWSAGQVHELVAEGRGGREATLDAQRDVRERMAFGTEPCKTIDCDWCEDEKKLAAGRGSGV